jgi:hypothetical protein
MGPSPPRRSVCAPAGDLLTAQTGSQKEIQP